VRAHTSKSKETNIENNGFPVSAHGTLVPSRTANKQPPPFYVTTFQSNLLKDRTLTPFFHKK
jgi:hypothetical protein